MSKWHATPPDAFGLPSPFFVSRRRLPPVPASRAISGFMPLPWTSAATHTVVMPKHASARPVRSALVGKGRSGRQGLMLHAHRYVAQASLRRSASAVIGTRTRRRQTGKFYESHIPDKREMSSSSSACRSLPSFMTATGGDRDRQGDQGT
jgi:hypothetical protein